MSDTRERAERQAIDWQMRLHQSPRNHLLRLRHRHWLARSMLHRQSWEEVQTMWQLMADVRPTTTARWPGVSRRISIGSIAAAACVLLAATLLWLGRPTHIPSQPLLSADGSRIWSAPDTRLETSIDAHQRRVTLHQGAAFFDVASDPRRPFTVEAAGVQVRVLGTAFSVALLGDQVQVEVERGRVKVGEDRHWSELGPGQMLRVDPAHLAAARPGDVIGPVAPWRDNLLVARGDSIDELVARIAAAHTGFVWLRDAELGRQRVTGLYDLNNPEQALASLVRPHGGQVRHIWPNVLLVEARKN